MDQPTQPMRKSVPWLCAVRHRTDQLWCNGFDLRASVNILSKVFNIRPGGWFFEWNMDSIRLNSCLADGSPWRLSVEWRSMYHGVIRSRCSTVTASHWTHIKPTACAHFQYNASWCMLFEKHPNSHPKSLTSLWQIGITAIKLLLMMLPTLLIASLAASFT